MSVEMWRTSQLWWQGPEWLVTDQWPEQPEILGDTSEMKITALIATRNEKQIYLAQKKSGPLTPAEIEQAETIILKTVQREVFLKEMRALEQQQSIPKGSKLSSLSPILDQEGVIRVGGRLSQADIPETQKHPILLPAKHHVTTILMRKEHLRLHHCGPEQLLYSTRVRESRRRGRIHISKAWIAVFTCFATKAVHIELVTELTTESFLAALRRFVARRGICSKIVSDNGTNFVGAARELAEVYEFLRKEKEAIATYLARQKIEWRFIPPRSPHFGSLWEAAVKATKRHEGSGDSLLFPPEYSYMKVPDNKLSRWQHAQKLRQHFWKRWQEEYLQELQKRHKWRNKGKDLEVGTLVILKEDNTPPLQWVLGRVEEVHPGKDN
ncbi:uncharacterized protein LOC112462817, partial [Temnothorax curvispinosus]|uniref:Uncharacterized protein LOC112462817 n=1 Tax=Temnothorax curvispinosus TaxID=300111 RepID=A0A6J1QUN2_9HYME